MECLWILKANKIKTANTSIEGQTVTNLEQNVPLAGQRTYKLIKQILNNSLKTVITVL